MYYFIKLHRGTEVNIFSRYFYPFLSHPIHGPHPLVSIQCPVDLTLMQPKAYLGPDKRYPYPVYKMHPVLGVQSPVHPPVIYYSKTTFLPRTLKICSKVSATSGANGT